MKIGLCGTHSVGKTTLIDKFVETNPDFVPITEGIRKFVEKYDVKNQYEKGSETLQFMYLYNHLLNAKKEESFISDRTVIDNFAYYLNLEGVVGEFIDIYRDLVIQHLDMYDIICYIPIEFEHEEDGFRFDKEMQKTIDETIIDLLKDFEIDYVLITGTVDERIEKLNDLTEKLL